MDDPTYSISQLLQPMLVLKQKIIGSELDFTLKYLFKVLTII